MTFPQIIIIFLLTTASMVGWTLVFDLWKRVKELRKTLIKLLLLSGVDNCGELYTQEEYYEDLNELLGEIEQVRRKKQEVI